MVKRKSSLADAVHSAARADQHPRLRVQPRTSKGVTKGVLLRLPDTLHRELRLLALDEDTSLQALGVEALKNLLRSRRR